MKMFNLLKFIKYAHSFQLLCKSLNLLANTNERIAINLIKMLSAGPEVSLRGSPTVSPTTAAL